MRLIAHRGLLHGPNHTKENRSITVMAALEREFEVEVDVWYVDGKWWLGHNHPLEEVPLGFLENPAIWVHCKNTEALRNATSGMHHFWHERDNYTINSQGFIWVYPGCGLPVPRPTVAVVTGKHDGELLSAMAQIGVAGICTDWPARMLKGVWT